MKKKKKQMNLNNAIVFILISFSTILVLHCNSTSLNTRNESNDSIPVNVEHNKLDKRADFSQYQSSESLKQINDSLNELRVDGIPIGYRNLTFKGNIYKDYKNIEEETGCKDWYLKSENLENLLQSMDLVKSVEWGASCYSYPCVYRGMITNTDDTFKIKINAASFVVLYNKTETIYFIAKNKSPFFLEPCDCCED